MVEDPAARLVRRRRPIETVRAPGMEVALVAAGDGVELIRHVLEAGSRWALSPEEGWEALEAVLVLSGRLAWHRRDGTVVLRAGDAVYAQPVRELLSFQALSRVTLLYVCSRPVFHRYSRLLQEMVELAVAVEAKDGYTRQHLERVLHLAMRVGERVGLPEPRLLVLNWGAFLHDLGKVRVPDHILGKPGPLTAEEWEVMKLHTVYGRQLLAGTYLEPAGVILEQHHERYDGSGYPYGLRGDEIALESHIVGAVDAYDAMVSDRVYRRAMSPEAAQEELRRQRGRQFHPDVVDALLAVLAEEGSERRAANGSGEPADAAPSLRGRGHAVTGGAGMDGGG